jgi:hypothetical protein
LEYLIGHNIVGGGFFQDMIHSGINAYLTLALAQTLLRAEDDRYLSLIENVAKLASPTGNWPEAVHPFSGGGCMGDGQHGWAAAEWVMIIRNLFVREEQGQGGRLVLGSGIPAFWHEGKPDVDIAFGPTRTSYGSVSLSLNRRAGILEMQLECDWHKHPDSVEVRLPGYRVQRLSNVDRVTRLKPQQGEK